MAKAEGFVEALLEIGFAAGQGAEPALAGIPVTGRRVDQNLGQAEAIEARFDIGRIELVGKKRFDGLEARLRRRLIAIEEGQFRKEHAEIGGKARHAVTYPRPIKGMVLVMTVMKRTFASSGSDAM